MAEKFDPANWARLEDPARLTQLPPSLVAGLLELRGDETVADFGAGTGMYTLPLAAAVPQGRIYAIDESRELLQRLMGKVADDPETAGRIIPVQTEAGRIPLSDGTADAAFAINVFHHVADQPDALAELARILRPGGRLAVLEYGDMERPIGPPRDHILSHAELRRLVTDMGLRELAVHEPGTLVPYYVAVVGQKAEP